MKISRQLDATISVAVATYGILMFQRLWNEVFVAERAAQWSIGSFTGSILLGFIPFLFGTYNLFSVIFKKDRKLDRNFKIISIIVLILIAVFLVWMSFNVPTVLLPASPLPSSSPSLCAAGC